MKLNLKKIRKVAEAATPGPWFRTKNMYGEDYNTGDCGFYGVGVNGEREELQQYEDTICEVWNTEFDGRANSDFISECNPTVVIHLLDEIDKLRKKLSGIK